MSEIIMVGLDLAKSTFQAHGAKAAGQPILRKRLRRDQVLAFFSTLPPWRPVMAGICEDERLLVWSMKFG